MRKVVIDYKKVNCDKLTKKQLKGIKNLKCRMKDENLACGETDKTGRITIDTLENMSRKMEKHINEEKIINEKEIKKVENNLNRHMEFWIPILKQVKKSIKLKELKAT